MNPPSEEMTAFATRRISRSAMRACRTSSPLLPSTHCSGSVWKDRTRTRRCWVSAGPTPRTRISSVRWCPGWNSAVGTCSIPPCRNPCSRSLRARPAGGIQPGGGSLPQCHRGLSRGKRAHRPDDRKHRRRHVLCDVYRRQDTRQLRLVLAARRSARGARGPLSLPPAIDASIPGRLEELPRPDLHAPESGRLAATR